jgi:protoporphyrin/coproporphyrin ferrochelatase
MVMSSTHSIGVLLMAYGSPESLDDIGPYLLDIRGGRPTSPELVAEIKERYAAIGGRSPLFDFTNQQADALKHELNRRFAGTELSFRSYLGMRHWEPRIKAAVAQLAADGITQLVALVMAPHSSRMSTGAYYSRLDEAIAELGVDLEVARIESWHNHPGLIDALAEKAFAAIHRFQGESPYTIFSAHSLPARILSQGDPYDSQLRETATLLEDRLGLPTGRWLFSYQSAGQSQEPWLGPQIEEVVVQLAGTGEKNLLVVPIGFVCDHVEVLYDIDIHCKQLANERGARLERSESLNTSPTFIAALADLVAAKLPVFEMKPSP